MSEAVPGPPVSVQAVEDRLDSWKEIAAYLKRDVTTVQRWEKREGMPVHRHLHDRIGSVHASRAELDAWSRGRILQAPQENPSDVALPDPPPAPTLDLAAPHLQWKYVIPLIAAVIAIIIGAIFWTRHAEYFWKSPIADARFQAVTDFDGEAQSAAVSRDGHFVAFLSDRDGPMDVWVTQVGSGQFHNLTHGRAAQLVNPSIRSLGFSPDGSLVTYWTRKENGTTAGDISVWALPTLGGEPTPYLEGVAEYDWSPDGSELVYHTPGPGDPIFLSSDAHRSEAPPIYTAPGGFHSHFPLWSPDKKFIYFVQGTVPDNLDIWRIRPEGGSPERLTPHNGLVTHPAFLNQRTLMYLAGDHDGGGPYLYSMDVERRIPHQLTSGPERYTSLDATADGHRLVATIASQKRTLWTLPIDDAHAPASPASPISLTTTTGFSPRLGPDYLLYVSATGTSESIWKVANGTTTELWRGQGARVIGGPAISADGRYIAFSVAQNQQTLLYTIQVDGTNARVVADSLHLEGAPAWAPDGESITVAANDQGTPHLFRLPLDGHPAASFVGEYSVDPAWAPDGRFVVYSGPDIGTVFSVKAVTPGAAPHPLPSLVLTRGARHLVFLPGGHELVVLRGEIKHKNLWLIDLASGAERPLTNLPPDFDIRDFDISPDGHELVLERVQERSDVVLLDLQRP